MSHISGCRRRRKRLASSRISAHSGTGELSTSRDEEVAPTTTPAGLPAAGGRLHRQRARQLGRRDRAGRARLRPDRQPAGNRGALFLGHALPARRCSARESIARLEVVGDQASCCRALYLGRGGRVRRARAHRSTTSRSRWWSRSRSSTGPSRSRRAPSPAASAAAVLTPSGQLREGNAIINVGFTVAGARRTRDRGPRGRGARRPDRAADRRGLLRRSVAADAGRDDVAARRCKAEPEPWMQAAARGPRVRAPIAPCWCGCSAMQAVAFVFFTLVLPIEIVYAKETLDAGDSGYGALLSAWGIGMVVGSLRLRRGRAACRAARRSCFVSTALIGVRLPRAWRRPATLPVACAAAAIGGLGNGVQWVRVDERGTGADRESVTRRAWWGCSSRSGACDARHRLHPRRRDRGAARAREPAS